MSGRTTIYTHTGTRRPADIGPANGGVLHSITILESGPGRNESLTVRVGGRSGAVICQLDYAARNVPLPQLKWEGVKLNGQLSLTLCHIDQMVEVEISDEVSIEMPEEAIKGPDDGFSSADSE